MATQRRHGKKEKPTPGANVQSMHTLADRELSAAFAALGCAEQRLIEGGGRSKMISVIRDMQRRILSLHPEDGDLNEG